jgi:hypothetical protein
MSIEYQDGTFSEDLSAEEAIKRFATEYENRVPVRALHIGTVEELKAVKEKSNMSDRIDALESKIKDLSPVKSDLIDTPTPDEIKRFTATNNVMLEG